MSRYLLIPLLCMNVLWCQEQQPASYTIQRASSLISVDTKPDDPVWQQAPLAGDFHFNWWTEGDQDKTDVRMLWDDKNLYVLYHCHDKHVSAYVTQRHGPVSKDDAVEIFISPNPEKIKNYYTFEVNALGTMLNRCKTDWWTGGPTWDPVGVQIRTSFQGQPIKLESAADHDWTVALAIPFENFSRDAAHTPPQDGDVWRLNLYRTGGVTNRQDSSWSRIPPGPRSFHRPESFGIVRFQSTK